MPEPSRPQAIGDHFHNRVNQALAPILHALQSVVQCHHHIFQMLFPQFQSRFISSQNAVFAFWVMKILSPVSCRLHFPKGLRCLTFIWLPYSRCPTHFFVVLVQFSPIAALNTFVDCLAKGLPISVNQRWSPPVLRNMIHTSRRSLAPSLAREAGRRASERARRFTS